MVKASRVVMQKKVFVYRYLVTVDGFILFHIIYSIHMQLNTITLYLAQQ